MAKIINYHQPKTSFLSVDKDMALITNALLKNERLKKLLFYTDSDPLGQEPLNPTQYVEFLQKQYIMVVPKLRIDEDVKNYIIITFDNFIENSTNPEFRDNSITFDIMCHFDQWSIKDNQLRPYRIAAEIDEIISNGKLSGIGRLQFVGAKQVLINNELGGLTLIYEAIHGGEDSTLAKDANGNIIDNSGELNQEMLQQAATEIAKIFSEDEVRKILD